MGLTLPQGNALRMGFEMGLFTGDSSGVGRHWIGPIIPASPPCRLEHLLPFSCLLPPPAWELWVWRSVVLWEKEKNTLNLAFSSGMIQDIMQGGDWRCFCAFLQSASVEGQKLEMHVRMETVVCRSGVLGKCLCTDGERLCDPEPTRHTDSCSSWGKLGWPKLWFSEWRDRVWLLGRQAVRFTAWLGRL